MKRLNIWSPTARQQIDRPGPQSGLSMRKIACHDMATIILSTIIEPRPTLQRQEIWNRIW